MERYQRESLITESTGDSNGSYVIFYIPQTKGGLPSDTIANPKNEV